jgi:hypothetical protein
MEEYVIQIDFVDRAGLDYEIFTLIEAKASIKLRFN